jgi:hypothetical protein
VGQSAGLVRPELLRARVQHELDALRLVHRLKRFKRGELMIMRLKEGEKVFREPINDSRDQDFVPFCCVI